VSERKRSCQRAVVIEKMNRLFKFFEDGTIYQDLCLFVLPYLSDSGIGLESGVFVATLSPGSPAARDCALTVGDRLLAVSIKTR